MTIWGLSASTGAPSILTSTLTRATPAPEDDWRRTAGGAFDGRRRTGSSSTVSETSGRYIGWISSRLYAGPCRLKTRSANVVVWLTSGEVLRDWNLSSQRDVTNTNVELTVLLVRCTENHSSNNHIAFGVWNQWKSQKMHFCQIFLWRPSISWRILRVWRGKYADVR